MKFILHISPYDERSAGVRAMFQLLHSLRAIGHETACTMPSHYNFEVTQRAQPGDFAIYPDCVPGNHLGATRIVRFFSAPADWTGPGFFNGGYVPASEKVVCYDSSLVENAMRHYDGTITPEDIFTIACIEPGAFYPEEKTIENLVYTGKQHVTTLPKVEGQIITRSNLIRSEFIPLLRKAKNIYSLDHYTMISQEAALCDCKAWKVMDETTFEPFAIPYDPAIVVIDRERDNATAERFSRRVCEFFL